MPPTASAEEEERRRGGEEEGRKLNDDDNREKKAHHNSVLNLYHFSPEAVCVLMLATGVVWCVRAVYVCVYMCIGKTC